MTKYFFIFVWLITFTFIFSASSYAEIVINEFSTYSSQDWVEVYNTSKSSIDLSSYRLRDSTASNKKDLTGTIEGEKFVSFSFGNDLNKAGDRLKLIKVEGDKETVVEEISYGDAGGICEPQENQTIGKVPDGSASVVRLNNATRDAPNTKDTALCISPSPTSEPSIAPTPKPTSSPSSSPNLVASMIALKSSPKISPKITPSPSEKENIGEVVATKKPLASTEVLGASKSAVTQFPFGLLIVGIGIVMAGAAGFMAFRLQKQV